MMLGKRVPAGQSMLELIFSIAIMVAVIIAVLALTTSNIVGQRESEQQVVANNLAREAIEVVRSLRDSNWLAGRPWDEGFTTPPVTGTVDWTLDPVSGLISWQYLPGSTATALYDDNGIYTHQPPAPDAPFYYSRSLTIRPICRLSDGRDQPSIFGDCSGASSKVGLYVAATVSWTESGRNRDVTLEDYLYAWK